jgi:hypothetical protein
MTTRRGRRANAKKRPTKPRTPRAQKAATKRKATTGTARPARRSLAERVEALRLAFEGAGIGLVNLVRDGERG